MSALIDAGVELRWIPFVPGPEWDLGYRPAQPDEIDDPALDDLLAGPAECDLVVAHLVPEYWPMVRRLYPHTPLVGHTVWETDRLPRHWRALLDEARLVLVPTTWNQRLLRSSGVRPPVEVVPHVAVRPRSTFSDVWSDIPSTAFVVYTIAPWTTRKALALAVRAYQSAFSGRSDTLLVIKTSPRDFTASRMEGGGPAAPGTAPWTLAQLCGEFVAPAPVRLVTGLLSDLDLDALHTRGDCYLSLCRSEGWGIPAFDAASWGNPVVITGYGGHLEYLDDESAFLVDYELVPVDDPAGGMSYTRDQNWAEPSIMDAARLLGQVIADPEEASARGSRARQRVIDGFDSATVARQFLDALESIL